MHDRRKLFAEMEKMWGKEKKEANRLAMIAK